MASASWTVIYSKTVEAEKRTKWDPFNFTKTCPIEFDIFNVQVVKERMSPKDTESTSLLDG